MSSLKQARDILGNSEDKIIRSYEAYYGIFL